VPFWPVAALGALGIFAGANLAFQAVLNTQLRTYLFSPLRVSFVSYAGGLVCSLLALLAARQSPLIWDPALPNHWWLWTGGIYGVIYLLIVVWLIPRLGSEAVFALVVAGQMIATLAFDQIGLFGIATRSVDPLKLLGAAFLIAGVILIRR
jgi:transporter family-2 protein